MAKLIDRIKGLFARPEAARHHEAKAELDDLASLHYEAVDYDQLPELERMEAEIRGRVADNGPVAIDRAAHAERIERELAAMKAEPEIHLESTRRYVMDDPEDAGSVYDTCDVLGPWDGLNPEEKLSALHELDWSGVADDDKRRIISREVDLSRVRASDRERYFGDLLTEPRQGQDARMDSDPLERARQRAREAVLERGRDKGMEIG